MASRENGGVKRKRVSLSVNQKLELIKKLEAGATVAHVCEEYGVKKQTVSDIRKAKDKLTAFSLKFGVPSTSKTSSVGGRKHMRVAQDKDLEEAVYTWIMQERSCGVNVRGSEIQNAAAKLAKHMGVEKFQATAGWLWRFRNRHGMVKTVIHSEAASAPTEVVETFRTGLNDVIKKEGFLHSQVYNAVETCLFWRSLPRNTRAFKRETALHGHKLNKERFSVLCCANADGMHRLQLAVVGRSARPRDLEDIMRQLPVHYYNSKKAWFNLHIFSNWFFTHFIPAVRKYQEDVLKLPADEVKALLILDNTPAHPNVYKAVSNDGKIRCMYLPPDTLLIQPMDQGVVVACKRLYQWWYLHEVLGVIKEEEDFVDDTRGIPRLTNIKNYNLKSAIFNLAASWKAMKITTLATAWKKLLYNVDAEYDFEGLEVRDFHCILQRAGETEVTEDDVSTWLEDTEGDPGYKVLPEDEIVNEVLIGDNRDNSDDDDKKTVDNKPKLSTVRDSIDTIISYIDLSSQPDVQPYYEHFKAFREIIVKKQHQQGKQMKRDNETVA